MLGQPHAVKLNCKNFAIPYLANIILTKREMTACEGVESNDEPDNIYWTWGLDENISWNLCFILIYKGVLQWSKLIHCNIRTVKTLHIIFNFVKLLKYFLKIVLTIHNEVKTVQNITNYIILKKSEIINITKLPFRNLKQKFTKVRLWIKTSCQKKEKCTNVHCFY